MKLQQELLDPAAGTKGELHPRVPSPTFSDANLYVGWHWSGDPLARWYTVMARSSRPKKNNWPCSVIQMDLQAQEHLLVSQVGCLSSLEWF